MYLFLLTFFVLYGLIHLFLFYTLTKTFQLIGFYNVIIALCLTILCFSPFLIRVLERNEWLTLARIFAFIGYLWMAAIFLFFVISIFFVLLKLILGSFFIFSSKFVFFLSTSMTFLLMIYGYFEAQNLKVEKITVLTSKLPSEVKKVKVVQISDLHLGLIIREERVKKVLKLVKELEPDILLATGDIVDGNANDIFQHIELFNNINPPLGKFAITGNHEYYAGIEQSVNFIKASGFKLLRGETVNIANLITVIGVDDDTVNLYGNQLIDEASIFSSFKKERFTIFLKHKPKVNMESIKHFDIQLSGHTHKGQIFPFNFLTKIAFPLDSGLFEIKEKDFFRKQERIIRLQNPLIYVSRGIGTWGPPIRILSSPEITYLELVRDVTN